MKLEFIEDSEELKAFAKELKHIGSSYTFDEYESLEIFQHKDGKYYQVGMGHRGKFIAHHKDFKRENPFVVSFLEVKPITEIVEVTNWEEVP